MNPLKNPFREYANKIADRKGINRTSNIVIDKVDTHIPMNLPTAIIGEKGSGKTTLIKAIIELTNKKVFNNIYLIYSPLTTDQVFPPDVIKIDVNDSATFLQKLFKIKSIFNSYYKFFTSLSFKALEEAYNRGKLTERDIMKHVDNNIVKFNKDSLNKIADPTVKLDIILNNGKEILKKFSKPFFIDRYQMNGFKFNDRDAVIIDDIAIASKIMFNSVKEDFFYQYLTLTRHMRLFILFAGQQLEQIPKKYRREIMCWIISKNTNLEMLKDILTRETVYKIHDKQEELKPYEFVLYNMPGYFVGKI